MCFTMDLIGITGRHINASALFLPAAYGMDCDNHWYKEAEMSVLSIYSYLMRGEAIWLR